MKEPRELYSESLDLFGQGKLEDARDAMDHLIKEHPKFLDVYEGLAMVHSRMGDQDAAIRIMETLARLDPDNDMVHTNLSVYYMKKGMKDKAEEEMAKATVLKFSKKKPRS